MTDSPRHPQSHDERGNLIGHVVLADGTIESVADLDAWADAFEAADDPAPLTPPRRGRPSLANDEGESPRVTVRLPRALLARADAAAQTLQGNRADLIRVALEQYLQGTTGPAAPTSSPSQDGRTTPARRATATKTRGASGLGTVARSGRTGRYVTPATRLRPSPTVRPIR